MKKPKAPKPLNVGAVTQAANTQNTQNAFQQAAFNRPAENIDIFGNTQSMYQTGTDAKGNPIFGAKQTLGATGQQFATGLAGLGQNYFDAVGNQPDLSSNAAFDKAYGYATANLEPRFEQARAGAENRLRNQGLDPTSEAYKSAMNDLALQQNEARNNLVTGLQGQMFNQGLSARQQQLGEYAPGMQFGQNVLNPNYANVPGVSVQNVDIASLYAQRQQDLNNRYNQQMKGYGGMLGGIGGLAGLGLKTFMGS